LHERIRRHSQAAAAAVKEEGRANDLLARLEDDSAFARVDVRAALDASRFVGRAPQQVDEFLEQVIRPLREKYARPGRLDATPHV
jgi:adenylosuccinate lyase